MIKLQKIKNLTALIMVFAMTFLSSGCSVVGLSIGVAIDEGKGDYKVVEEKQLESIRPGTETIVNLKDGSQKKGDFAGLTQQVVDKDVAHDRAVAVPDSGIILKEYGLAENTTEYNFVPLRSIECVKISNDKNLKYTFLGIGLLFDALVILGGGSYIPNPWGKE